MELRQTNEGRDDADVGSNGLESRAGKVKQQMATVGGPRSMEIVVYSLENRVRNTVSREGCSTINPKKTAAAVLLLLLSNGGEGGVLGILPQRLDPGKRDAGPA